jgi:hypothetical protein
MRVTMSELHYDIQEMFIEGLNADEISQALEIPKSMVLDCLKNWNVADEQQDLSPYNTINS